MKALFSALVCLSLAGVAAAEDSLDPALVGDWETTVTNDRGTWQLAWHCEKDGRYRTTFRGAAAIPDETGALSASGGKWSSKKDNGQTDGGTYRLDDKDTLVFTGAAGSLTWRRRAAQSPAAGGDASELPPVAIDPHIVGTWMHVITDKQNKQHEEVWRFEANGNWRMWFPDNLKWDKAGGTASTQGGNLHLVWRDKEEDQEGYLNRNTDTGEDDYVFALKGSEELTLSGKGGGLIQVARVPDGKYIAPRTLKPTIANEEVEGADADRLFEAGRAHFAVFDMRGGAVDFLRAAKLGSVKAQIQIAWHYFLGHGTPKNSKRAYEWYRAAALTGDAQAENDLGNMFRDGEGTGRSWSAALYWYTKSSAQGWGKAQYNMGYMYEFGLSVPEDRAQAIAWYRLAAAQGNKAAAENVAWLSDPTNVSFRTAEERDAFIRKELQDIREASEKWDRENIPYYGHIAEQNGHPSSDWAQFVK